MKNKNRQQSPSALAWQRFRKNRLGMAAACFIVVVALLAVFAYNIIPDPTPNANRQLLEISTRKPGFEVDMLVLPKENPPAQPGFFQRLLEGRPDDCTYLPFDSIQVFEDHTLVYLFNPEQSGSVRVQEIPTARSPVSSTRSSGWAPTNLGVTS